MLKIVLYWTHSFSLKIGVSLAPIFSFSDLFIHQYNHLCHPLYRDCLFLSTTELSDLEGWDFIVSVCPGHKHILNEWKIMLQSKDILIDLRQDHRLPSHILSIRGLPHGPELNKWANKTTQATCNPYSYCHACSILNISDVHVSK